MEGGGCQPFSGLAQQPAPSLPNCCAYFILLLHSFCTLGSFFPSAFFTYSCILLPFPLSLLLLLLHVNAFFLNSFSSCHMRPPTAFSPALLTFRHLFNTLFLIALWVSANTYVKISFAFPLLYQVVSAQNCLSHLLCHIKSHLFTRLLWRTYYVSGIRLGKGYIGQRKASWKRWGRRWVEGHLPEHLKFHHLLGGGSLPSSAHHSHLSFC